LLSLYFTFTNTIWLTVHNIKTRPRLLGQIICANRHAECWYEKHETGRDYVTVVLYNCRNTFWPVKKIAELSMDQLSVLGMIRDGQGRQTTKHKTVIQVASS
jgi:hypothetical protein